VSVRSVNYDSGNGLCASEKRAMSEHTTTAYPSSVGQDTIVHVLTGISFQF